MNLFRRGFEKNRSRINLTSVEHSVKVTSVDILGCIFIKFCVVSARNVCQQAEQRMRKCAETTGRKVRASCEEVRQGIYSHKLEFKVIHYN